MFDKKSVKKIKIGSKSAKPQFYLIRKSIEQRRGSPESNKL